MRVATIASIQESMFMYVVTLNRPIIGTTKNYGICTCLVSVAVLIVYACFIQFSSVLSNTCTSSNIVCF